MDWLEEKLEEIRAKIKRMSLKRALICYIVIAAAAAALAVLVTEIWLGNWYQIIYERNCSNVRENVYTFSYVDEERLRRLQLLRTALPFLYLGISVFSAAVLFHRNRLKVPFKVLMEAADAIGRGNLDVNIEYDSEDEMGQLCRAFENVRCEVVRDKETMWKMIEDQREINAAFAHDLRTPLTVLRGYSDFLYRYIPEGRISAEKLAGTLKLMSEHIQRLEAYSRTMKNIRNFEEIDPDREEIDILRLQARMQETIDALNRIGEVRICFEEKSRESRMINVDESMILEVFENLISNAVRFADQRIEVAVEMAEAEEMLYLFVKDDGPGFLEEELSKAVSPYFRGAGKKDDMAGHFGIGLHIAATLCQKHGGTLSLANSVLGGALVSVSFSCRKS